MTCAKNHPNYPSSDSDDNDNKTVSTCVEKNSPRPPCSCSDDDSDNEMVCFDVKLKCETKFGFPKLKDGEDAFAKYIGLYRWIKLRERRVENMVYTSRKNSLRSFAEHYLVPKINIMLGSVAAEQEVYWRYKGDSFSDQPMRWIRVKITKVDSCLAIHSMFSVSQIVQIISEFEDKMVRLSRLRLVMLSTGHQRKFLVPSSWETCDDWRFFPSFKITRH